MPTDLEIIAQLAKRIGRKLKELDKISYDSVGYQLNSQQQVIGLGLYQCELNKLPAEIVQLQNLWLNSNKLNKLPAEIGQLQNLWLHSNKLNKLPAEIGQLKNSCQLFISKNPLKTPPYEIAEKGISAIRDYSQSLEKEEEKYPLNEAKVIGGVGKTSLVNRLLYNTYNDAESKTEGINVEKWQVAINNQQIRLNIWDFGGQEIMHATP